MFVLVTGSSGAIGRQVCRELSAQGDSVRGFDRKRYPEPAELFVGELEDRAHLRAALEGVDAVVHLAANPTDAAFDDLLGPNLVGVYNLLDAARSAGVRRVVLASSVQVIGGSSERRVTLEQHAPGNIYGVTKLFAEELGALYARRYELDVIVARIGWMVRDEREARRMQELSLQSIYVSPGDVARFFHAAVHADFRGFGVFWALGAGSSPRFDLEPAERTLGYRPSDAFPAGLPFAWPARAPSDPDLEP